MCQLWAETQLTYRTALEMNKNLFQLNAEFSRILNKVTEYTEYVSDIGAGDQLDEINSLVTCTL